MKSGATVPLHCLPAYMLEAIFGNEQVSVVGNTILFRDKSFTFDQTKSTRHMLNKYTCHKIKNKIEKSEDFKYKTNTTDAPSLCSGSQQ